MVRKGPYKLIAGHGDPPMLFDLGADPDERHDLARDPGSAGPRAELEAVIARTWDVDALDRAVRESQAARRLVGAALGAGARAPWDYRPTRDASRLYFRAPGDVQDSYAGSVRR